MQQMMDRALKERIIGAIVLVVFAVLVVPVFLDGPSDHADEVSEAITLPGQNGQAAKNQTIVLPRNRTEPVPVADSPGTPQPDGNRAQAATTESLPGSASPPPATRDNPADATSREPQSSTGMWAVQLGSFSNKQNAEKLAADLRGNGYAAFISRSSTNTGSWHRVRIGPQKDRENAETVARKLAAEGHKGQVVPHP